MAPHANDHGQAGKTHKDDPVVKPAEPRILVATNMFPTPEYPWLGVFVREQVDSLKSLGLNVDLSIHLGRVSRWNYFRGLYDLAGKLRKNHFDLIHSHHTYSTFLALAANRLAFRSVPVIQTFHEGEIFSRGVCRAGHLPGRLKYSGSFKRRVLEKCRHLIPVNADMLPALFGRDGTNRCPPDTIVPAGIDMDMFHPRDRLKSRRALGWSEDDPYFFFPYKPGIPGKRIDLARLAVERFSGNGLNAHLITGGNIPHEKIPDVICASNAVLALSDYEASPTIVKESLACEIPVISTDVGDVRSSYGHLDGILLCDENIGNLAKKLGQSMLIPSPFGGRECLTGLELDLRQVAKRIRRIYLQVLEPEKIRGGHSRPHDDNPE